MSSEGKLFDNGGVKERTNAVSRTMLDRKPNTPYPISSRLNRPASVSDATPYYPRKRKAFGSPDRQDIIDDPRASDPKSSATEAEYRVPRLFNGDRGAFCTKPWQGTWSP